MTPINIPKAPADFDTYWGTLQEELDALEPAPELTPVPMRSTEFATLYEVNLTSVGPYRILAHYSVPKGEGPFPVVYHAPGYGSVVHIPSYEERQQYVTVALRHRGQRLSDRPYAAAYPGLLTDGVDQPESYVFRGIVADCCRVIDFLVERPEVDSERISIMGNDLALVTAALRPQIGSLYCTPSLFYGAAQLAQGTSAYPWEEFNDYARAYPDMAKSMWDTLAYFEPTYFASRVQANPLVVTGSANDRLNATVLEPLLDAFERDVETYETAHSGSQDGAHQLRWCASQLGVGEALMPSQWQ